MKTFPLEPPPISPGIYALRNKQTKEIYIGQSTNLQRRLQEWRGLFMNKIGRTSAKMMAIARDTDIADWEFCIISTAPVGDLDRLEAEAIRKTQAAGICVNVMDPGAQTRKKRGVGHERKTTVLGPRGPMTYGDVAATLGVTYQAVKKRLRGLRDKGVTEVKISQLQ